MEQKKLNTTKLDEKKKDEEKKKMPDNTVIIGNSPLMNYLWSVNYYMCGETYDREKGINIQWDEAHENTAKTFIDINLRRHGFRRIGEIRRVEFDDFEKIGKKEMQRHRVVFIQNVKLVPAIEP